MGLPGDVQGVFQVVIQTNAGLIPIFENGASGNNIFADANTLTLTVPPNPDLQVFSIDNAPPTANAGGTVQVAYTIINQGTVAAHGQWQDSVYVSLKNTLDGSAILLGSFGNQSALLPGEKYQTTTTDMNVPGRLGGPAYLIIDANSNGAVDEFPHGDNNTFVKSIYINPEPPADLVTGTVVAPNQTFDGKTIPVTYHVSNLGLGPTNVTSWTDTIWLTTDKTRPNTTKGDVLLATIPHTGLLGNDPTVISPPTGYDVTAMVTLPKHIVGQYYITAWSDSFDVVLKSTLDANINPDDPNQLNNDNYKARPITVLLTPPPDLVVTSVAPQATAVGGDSYAVTWTVTNQGTSPTEDSVLFDQVYLSNSPTFNANNPKQWFLGTVEHDGSVASNGSYTANQTFQLSPEISGQYVIVVCNTGNLPIGIPPTWEGPYTNNNTNSAATHVVPLPPADLQVTNITTQAPNYSGEQTAVTWTVTNEGAAAWSGSRYWVDRVYFSKYPTLDVNRDPLEAEVPHSNDQPLASQASYTQSATFNLPPGIGGTVANPGTFYVYVITGYFDALTSHSLNNDDSRGYFTTRGYEDPTNNQSSATLPVIYREADLVVSNLVVPTTAPQSGDTIPVTFTVTNIGNRDTRTASWVDRIYLSNDSSLHNDDTELGEVGHNGILKIGASYTVTLNVRLPDGIGGNFDLLAFVDANVRANVALDVPGLGPDGSGDLGRVLEYQGEGNNITAAALPITMRPPPDLQVAVVTATGPDAAQPDHVFTGQTFTVSYTVTNAGAGDTPNDQTTWVDQIWLSRDPILDDADVYFDELTHTGGLKAGASYTMTDTIKAPQNLIGPWYVFVITDPITPYLHRGNVFEGNNETNNATPTAVPLLIDQPPPSDLQVTAIVIPSSAMSGDPVTIQWTITNTGANPASGSWTDAAYLSPSPIWDYTNPVIGRMAFSGTILPGGTYTETLNAHLPLATPGQYRVVVRANIFEDLFESSYDNNTTASASPLTVAVPALQLGVPLNTTLDTGETRLYQITVPAGRHPAASI